MPKVIFKILVFVSLVAGCSSFCLAQELQVAEVAQEELVAIYQSYVTEKTKYTGTLDLYDSGSDSVRNLRAMDTTYEVKKEDPNVILKSSFRDIRTGDIVTLDTYFKEIDGGWQVAEQKIAAVQPLSEGQNTQTGEKEYTDQEVQQVMADYLKKRSQFTGTYDIFDKDKEALRKLETGQFQPEVRRFGTLFISTVDCIDQDTKEKVQLDVQIGVENGVLSVTTIRIIKVSPAS